MNDQHRFDNSSVGWRSGLIPVAALLWICTTALPPALAADPRVILQAHLSHGIGDSPFDSPLVNDPAAAEMIVRARKCAPVELLRGMAGDPGQGGGIIEELRAAGVLMIKENRACTTFPILLGAERMAYAKLTKEVAAEARAALSTELGQLLQTVGQRGWKQWQYHFLWSQLFDSQFAWTEMTQRKLVPPLAQVIAWVIYPDHPFRSGTNYYPDTELRDHWLMVSWRAEAAETVGIVAGAWEIIYKVGVEGSAMSADERARLAELDLVDEDGQLLIPILRNGDPLLDQLQSLAARYVSLLEQRMPLDSLMAVTGVDRQYTFAMAYHDISWEILAESVRAGLLEVPPGLSPKSRQTARSMRGVAALAPAHAPFVELIREAIPED